MEAIQCALSGEWKEKMMYIYTMGYYSAILHVSGMDTYCNVDER